MSPGSFPVGSVRAAVARHGDDWIFGLGPGEQRRIEAIARAEIRDRALWRALGDTLQAGHRKTIRCRAFIGLDYDEVMP